MHSILGENMAKIHFTYVQEDIKIATALANFLRENGQDLFLASANSKMVNPLFNNVSLDIKSVDFLVVILSDDALKNKRFKNQISTSIGYYRERNHLSSQLILVTRE